MGHGGEYRKAAGLFPCNGDWSRCATTRVSHRGAAHIDDARGDGFP